MKYFVFLEFLDPRVESTLRELRDALQPAVKAGSPIHITVRGPYRQEPDQEYMLELGRRLRGHGVRLIGAGMFSTPNGYVVFQRAESAAFREIWWKPDYHKPLHEIEPHLTLYESKDRTRALLALNFLKASRISIQTYSVQLSIYSTGQRDLFGTRAVGELLRNQAGRGDIVAIDPEVLPAARELGLRLAKMGGTDSVNPLPRGRGF